MPPGPQPVRVFLNPVVTISGPSTRSSFTSVSHFGSEPPRS